MNQITTVNKKVIVNGAFDILHVGHVALLEYAKSLGDHLLVCVDSDSRVKQLKGELRPINIQADRVKMLGALRCVDMVQVFDTEEQLIEQIKLYQPDVMVKGSDYKGKSIVGESLCKQVIYYDRTEHSTTKTIQHIINR
jgi:D-beta-D-heptose 7-phosphate kinase/D-beta-D-heptose 1-phosphate adenosyltransferase